ncbi:MAG: hypothetical protein ACW974_06975 [Candidatus Thorarchaeota archaeon]
METKNPFQPLIFSEDIMVTVKEDGENKKVDAKRYWIRYKVGESSDIRYVDGGEDDIASMEDKTIFMVPSIHRLTGDPFHYDGSATERISGSDRIESDTQFLNRLTACESHDIVEVIYESPGVECCAMTKEQADEQEVPLQYMSGYLLGKKNGLMKVALSKTVVDETNHTYYDNIHVIPEATVKEWNCLE